MRYRAVVFMTTLVIGLMAGAAFAHEQWIDVSCFYPAPGETVEVNLCSGHHFPESSYPIKDKVVEGLRVWDGGADPRVLESVADEKYRTAELPISHEGVHVLDLTLKRPGAKVPSYEAKAIVTADRLKDDPARYALGEGLEVTPGESVGSVRAGDTLSVRLTLDGRPLAGSLQVVPEKGRTGFTRTEPDEPALVPIRTAGRYLVTAQVGGRGASLVFEVLKEKEPADKGEGSR